MHEAYHTFDCLIITQTHSAVLLSIKGKGQHWVPQSVIHGADWLWLERCEDPQGTEREMRIARWWCRKKSITVR